MPRDTFISWKWFVLFLFFPGLLLVTIVFFPITLAVLFWLYYRGKAQAADEALDTQPQVQQLD